MVKIVQTRNSTQHRLLPKLLCILALCWPVLLLIAAAENDAATSISAADSVRLFVEKELSESPPKPKSKIVRLQLATLYAGKAGVEDWSVTYLPEGLLGINVASTGWSTIKGSRLSLAGFVDLVDAVDSEASWASSTAVSVGRVYIPFTLNTAQVSSSASRLDELSGDIGLAIKASANSSFQFRQLKITDRKSKTGWFSSSGTLKNSFVISCTVGEDKPAAELNPNLRGDYRLAKCEYKNVTGPSSRQEYAYLVDSGIYVRLFSQGSKTEFTYSVTAVDYEK